MTFTRNRNVRSSTYHLNGVSLQKVDTIRDLGVQLDRKLSFMNHFDSIVAKASKMIGFVKRACSEFRSVSTLKLLYNTLVRSILEYASPVWNPSYRVHVNRIERVQKSFTRFLRFKCPGCPYGADYSVRLSYFSMTSLEQRRNSSDRIMLYKIINNLINVPDLLSEISICVPRQSLVRPKRKVNTFTTSSSKTKLGQNAPMNRLITSYNKLDSCCGIDIFADTLVQFAKKSLTGSEEQL
ncbi:uncharacterized protein LOC123661837 [Melitaea cinxia]|uniref:uncharacterized protein LOC123661837 n=1 Tax=Melitaea cinxia TaxID=113334 RepID=UPI001E26E93D|nr:uncharacterized protein LOC123661837 [Melitaea cinxia]